MPLRLVTAGVIGIISVNIYYFKKVYSYWSDKNVPTINPAICSGNLKGVGSTIHWAHRLQEVYEEFKDKPFAGFYFWTTPQLIAIDLDLINKILVTDFESFKNRGLYYNGTVDPLSANLYNLDSERLRKLRLKIATEFNVEKIKLIFSKMDKSIVDIKDLLDAHLENKKVIDIKDFCVRFTADTIGSCAFGLDCNSLKTEDSKFIEAAKRIFDFSTKRRLQFFIQNTFKGIAQQWGLRVFERDTEKFFMTFIRDVVEKRNKNDENQNDFMSLLMEVLHGSDSKVSFEEIAAQAFFIFFAGFETTSAVMACALYELAKNQDMQDKVREEIERVLEKYDGNFTFEALNEMVYMEQIFKGIIEKLS